MPFIVDKSKILVDPAGTQTDSFIMKSKLTLFVTVLAVALFMVGCATPETQLTTASSKTVEREIRIIVGKGKGILTDVDYLKVGRINLHNKKVNDISLLAKCKNLTDINLTYNHILEDITPLKGLKKLRVLKLDLNNISDISPLAELTELEWLGVHGNNITDLTPLANLKKLQHLNVGANKIKDISVVQNFTALEYLDIRFTSVKDLSSLTGLNLVTIDAQDSQISKVDGLKGMKTLKSLSAKGTFISEEDRAWLGKMLEDNKK